MASLCTGNYGMSQLKSRGGSTSNNNNGSGGGKEYIFVKMTDSAFQAVEEYQRQLARNSNCGAATIQFIGNSGMLAFPVDNVKSSSSKFRFSLDVDFDSSIECIEQNRNHLDVVGAMSNRMRIHANDDVYEKTKNRMAAVEEVQKNKCAREIKPNQTDIGRKVKVKVGSSTNNISSNSNSAIGSQQYVNNYRSTSNNTLSILSNQTASFKNGNNRVSSVSKTLLPPSTTTNHIGTSHQQQPQQKNNVSANNISSNNTITQAANSNMNTPKSEISKRKIRERLIHLLALKPFKKPELIQRLINEGLRDKERGLISVILKDISQLKDNCYNLKHSIWNDVNENWPFYTEQEIQQLKRRKPQNLTPESSDGGSSSISGQSPSSAHNGCSPSMGIKRPPSSSSTIGTINGGVVTDNNYDDIAIMQAKSKKARISHFKKDLPTQQPISNQANNRNSLNHNIHQQEDDFNKFSYNNNNNNRSPFLNQNEEKYKSPQRQMQQQQSQQQSPKPSSQSKRSKKQHQNNPPFTGRQQPSPHQMTQKQHQQPTQPCPKIVTSSVASAPTNTRTQNPPLSKPSAATTTDYSSSSSSHLPEQETTTVSYDFSMYPRIVSIEERRRYKTEFDNDFVEYRTLSEVDERSAQRFQDLGKQLDGTDSPSEKRFIEDQIVKEYQKVRDDRNRFKYLHEKLNHIKLRVQEYDDQLREQLREENRRRFVPNETIDADNYEPSNGNNGNY